MQTTQVVYRVLMVALIVLSGCSKGKQGDETPAASSGASLTTEQKRLASVQTGQLEDRLISSVVSCTGEIEVPPQGMASVAAPLGGYIVETAIVPGTQVKKGQRLATLSNPDYIALQQSYLETAGQFKFAEQEFQRQKTLGEQNATALKKLQESESSYTVLKARLDGLREQLKIIGINVSELENGNIQSVVLLRSPLTGYVTSVNHHPGEFVDAREAIFEIVNMDHLHLHLNVFEQDISAVQKDQPIRFRPTGSEGQLFSGKVLLVSPKRNEEIRSFDVHGHIETGEDQLKPGMYVQADILVSADTVAALPERALVYSGNKAFAIVEQRGQYVLEEVLPGAKMDGWVEIRNADALRNQNVVTEGASRLYVELQKAN